MATYSGSALVIDWVTSSGTTGLHADYRTLSYTPTIDLIETTAGADADKNYVVGVKSGNASFAGIMQASGTAITAKLIEGQIGTLKIYPEGSASTKQMISFPAICMGSKYSIAYAGLNELSADWTQNGARTDGTAV
jgi:hypothetical protein